MNLVTGVENHPGALRQAGEHFGFEVVALANLRALEPRPATRHGEHGPILPFAEERSDRNLGHVPLFLNHDPGFDAIGVAECAPPDGRVGENKNHVDALFLDAERGDFQETRRLDDAYTAGQRRVAAPEFEVRRVAEFEQARAAL